MYEIDEHGAQSRLLQRRQLAIHMPRFHSPAASKDYWDNNCEVPDWRRLRVAAWELRSSTRDIARGVGVVVLE